MLYVYLAALVVGGGIIATQVFFSHDAHGGAGHDVHGHDGGAASIFLSSRFWTFAFLAFGLVGVLLTFFQLAGPTLGIALSSGSGLAAGCFAALAFRALRRSAGDGGSMAETVGKVGRVLLACGRGRVGKVRLSMKGQTIDLLATTDEDEIAAGQRVMVHEIRGDIAHVMPAPRELTE